MITRTARRLAAALPTASARIAAVILLGVLVLTAFGPALAPYDPLAQNPDAILRGPDPHHLFGTDELGRDVLSRIVTGTRPTVLSALAMVGIGVVGGALPGIASVLLGHRAAGVALRGVDALLTLPGVVVAIAVAGVFGNGPATAALAVGTLFAPRLLRVVRAEALGYAHTQYVEAAELLGASRLWIVRRHIWRKTLPTLGVTTALTAGYAVLATTSLGFLGLGVQPPHPTWGGMLAGTVQQLWQDAWGPLWPGLFIIATVWSCNALADTLRRGEPAAAAPGTVKEATRV
ncbi:ABC transporter permease [Streptomyces sp. NPDC001037]|uniref:ABC transporter permease n=1 Tax=Streptomyces sp. NPDC001037 TaxID=3364542 RepID=UPI0036CAA1E0